MNKTLCILTIGQSPRSDMKPTITEYLPHDLTVIEKGLLDDLSDDEIERLAPGTGEKTLVSRRRDGSSVKLGEEHVIAGLARLIEQCHDESVDVILLACTGKFELFNSRIPIIYPDHLVTHVVKGLFQESKLGIIVPVLEQVDSIQEKWMDAGLEGLVLASSPYDFKIEDFVNSAKKMNDLPVGFIVLDCMGYTDEMKKIMLNYTSKPILVARNIVFSALAELF